MSDFSRREFLRRVSAAAIVPCLPLGDAVGGPRVCQVFDFACVGHPEIWISAFDDGSIRAGRGDAGLAVTTGKDGYFLASGPGVELRARRTSESGSIDVDWVSIYRVS